MKANGSSKLKSFSLSFIILLNVSSSAFVLPFVSLNSLYSTPLFVFFLSVEKYPSCAVEAFPNPRYFPDFIRALYSSSNIRAYLPFLASPVSGSYVL